MKLSATRSIFAVDIDTFLSVHTNDQGYQNKTGLRRRAGNVDLLYRVSPLFLANADQCIFFNAYN